MFNNKVYFIRVNNDEALMEINKSNFKVSHSKFGYIFSNSS